MSRVIVEVPVDPRLIRGPLPRCARAALAVDPAGVTIQVLLLLPDGQAMLDLIDDVPAGAERLIAVRGAHLEASAAALTVCRRR